MNRRKFFKNLSLASTGVILTPIVVPELIKETPFNQPLQHNPTGYIYDYDVIWEEECVIAEFGMQQEIDRELIKFLSNGQKKVF